MKERKKKEQFNGVEKKRERGGDEGKKKTQIKCYEGKRIRNLFN